jgi:hypothetical protein
MTSAIAAGSPADARATVARSGPSWLKSLTRCRVAPPPVPAMCLP